MSANATAILTVRLKDLVTGPASGLVRSFGRIRDEFKNLRSGFDLAGQVGLASNAVKQFGNQASGVLKSILRPAFDFEEAITRVGAVTTGATKKDLQDLEKTALEMGQKTKYSATQAAEGLYSLATAGLNAAEQQKALPVVMQLALASGRQIGPVAEMLVDVTSMLKKPMSEMGDVAQILTKTFSASTTSIEDIYETLKYSASTATTAGIDFKQLAVMVGVLGSSAKGSMAGTAIKSMLSDMVNPMPKARKELAKLGLSGKTLEKDLKTPVILLDKIMAAFKRKKISDAGQLKIMNIVFGERGMDPTTSLMKALKQVDDKGVTVFDRMKASIYSNDDVLGHMATTMGKTSLSQIENLTGSIETLNITIAKELAPTIRGVLKDLISGVEKVSKWVKSSPDWVVGIGKTLLVISGVSLVLAPILLTLSSIISLVTLIRGGFIALKIPILIARGLFSGWIGLAKTLNATLGEVSGKYTTIAKSSRSGGMVLDVAEGSGMRRGWAKAGQLIAGSFSVAAAGFLAYELTTWINEGLGKSLKTKTGTVTGDVGLAAGGSEGLNRGVKAVGDTLGIKALSDVAEGNLRRNDEELKSLTAQQVEQLKANADKFNKEHMRGLIQIEVDDARAKVKKLTKTGGGPNLEVGWSSYLF